MGCTESAAKELELVMAQLEIVSAELNDAATKLSLLLLTIRRLRKELGVEDDKGAQRKFQTTKEH